MLSRGLVRTLLIRTRRKHGNLGLLTSALGDAGAAIGEILTKKIGHSFTLREFNVLVDDEEHLQGVLEAVAGLADSELVEVNNPVRAIHQGGKVRMLSRVPLDDISALEEAVGPGVLEIVRCIDDDPDTACNYTALGRTVGVISDGTGLRGAGRVQSLAMLPVLEAKVALLSSMGGLNGLPLVLDVRDEDEFVSAVKAIAPSMGAILLDAVAGARAMRVFKRLREELDIPIIHDDGDAPAVAGLAAVINACRRAGKNLEEVTIGQVGLGTAGGAIAELVMRYTGRPVYGEDVNPSNVGRHVAVGGKASNIDEIMSTCDVVVANTGHAGVIPPSKVREGQAILALSEPRPEIEPYDALLAGAAFAADGKAMSKSVVLPGAFLGTLAVRATELNNDMRVAAATTLADAAEDEDLLPTPLDEGIHARVGAAVARAAVRSGVARRDLSEDELTPEVFEQLINEERALPL
jgi:malate dehydrogenase (oxaloacetate-decarboxylating)